MILATQAQRVIAAHIQQIAIDRVVAKGRLMALHGFSGNFGNAGAFNRGGGTGEVFLHKAGGKPNRIEDLRAAIGLISADAHLGHHLHHALANRLDEVLLHFIRLQLHIHPLADVLQRFKGKIGVYRFRAIAGQHAEMMHLPRFTRFHHKPGGSPQALADQMMMHRRCCQQRRNGNALSGHRTVRQHQDVMPGQNRFRRGGT